MKQPQQPKPIKDERMSSLEGVATKQRLVALLSTLISKHSFSYKEGRISKYVQAGNWMMVWRVLRDRLAQGKASNEQINSFKRVFSPRDQCLIGHFFFSEITETFDAQIMFDEYCKELGIGMDQAIMYISKKNEGGQSPAMTYTFPVNEMERQLSLGTLKNGEGLFGVFALESEAGKVHADDGMKVYVELYRDQSGALRLNRIDKDGEIQIVGMNTEAFLRYAQMLGSTRLRKLIGIHSKGFNPRIEL